MGKDKRKIAPQSNPYADWSRSDCIATRIFMEYARDHAGYLRKHLLRATSPDTGLLGQIEAFSGLLANHILALNETLQKPGH